MHAKFRAARRLFATVVVALLLEAPGVQAGEEPFASTIDKSQSSSVRLLAGARDGGVYTGGVRIELAPHAVTYWRQPGDSGAPPVFDFSASENVAAVDIFYPVPKHMAEADGVVAGYDETVTFPIRVAPHDAKSPVKLDLRLSYAACYKICLPARAHLVLDLPREGVSPFEDEVSRALSRVPRKLDAAQSAKLFALSRRDDHWRLNFVGPGKMTDLFADMPEWAYLSEAHRLDDGDFEFKIGTNAAASAEDYKSMLTILTDQGAYEIPFSMK